LDRFARRHRFGDYLSGDRSVPAQIDEIVSCGGGKPALRLRVSLPAWARLCERLPGRLPDRRCFERLDHDLRTASPPYTVERGGRGSTTQIENLLVAR
jgi:hypothetical protein